MNGIIGGTKLKRISRLDHLENFILIGFLFNLNQNVKIFACTLFAPSSSNDKGSLLLNNLKE